MDNKDIKDDEEAAWSQLHIDENGVLTCGCDVSGFFVEVEEGCVSVLTCVSCGKFYKAKDLPERAKRNER